MPPVPPDAPVILAYDGSPAAGEAIRLAGALVGGGPAIVATAWEPVGGRWPGPVRAALRAAVPDADAVDRTLQEEARAVAERGVGLADAAGFSARAVALEAAGGPAAALARLAATRKAGLIAAGTRRRRAPGIGPPGSVAERLLEAAGRPVLVVGPDAMPLRGTRVTLRDGAAIILRPIEPSDKAVLADGMRRLSPESRYRRFLTPRDDLSDAELAYLTEVDHRDHEAILAIDPATADGIGVARWVRLADRPDTAEVATTVVDDWQGRGVGEALLTALTDRARAEDVTRYVAMALEDNAAMQALLADLGPTEVSSREGGVIELTTALPEHGVGAVLDWLRAAARGTLSLRGPRLHR